MTKLADAHVHIDRGDGKSVRYMLDTLRDIGITDLSLLSICASPKHDITNNVSVLRWKREYTDVNIRAFGSFHEVDRYASIPYLEQTERLLALGCDGIKFLHMKPDLRKLLGKGINHPDYDPALSLMEELGTPVLIHSGDPETFWDASKISPAHVARGWFYGDGTYPSYLEIYGEDFAMLDKHPRLNVVFAHFFFLSNRIDEAKRIMEKYPNVKFDLTPGGEMYLGFSKDIDSWHDFFETYSDRILYGTDSNDEKSHNPKIHELVRSALTHDRTEFPMPGYGDSVIRGLDLSSAALENIRYKNYERYVGTEPKPVNQNALLDCVERMLCDLRTEENREKSIAILQNFIQNA